MRIKQIFPLILVAVGATFGYFAGLCGINGSCFFSNYFHNYAFAALEPLYIFSLFSIPAVILLPFVKERVFSSWLRFAIIWLTLSVIVIASTEVSTNSWFSIMSFVREDAARMMGILFSGLSLFVLAWQTYMPKRIRDASL